MIAIVCLCIPAIILVIIRNRLAQKKKELYQNVIQYVCSIVLLNCVMILVLRILFSNRGDLFFKLNNSHVFALKYIALSVVLAIAFPFLENLIKRAYRRLMPVMPWLKEGSRSNNVYKLLQDSAFFKIAIFIQVVLLLYICLLNLDPRYEYTFDKNEISSSHENVTSVDNGYRIAALKEGQDSATVLKTESFALAPGAYEITIDYNVELEDGEEASFSVNEGKLNLASSHHGNCYSWSKLALRDSLNSVSQRVYIKAITDIDDFSLQVEYSGTAPLTVYDIKIQEITGFRFIRFFFPLIVFFIFDALFVYFYTGEKKDRLVVAGLIAVIILSSLPLFSDFILSGHDLSFHLNRIVSFAEELKAGNLWPSIYSTTLNGYGYAAPIFYGQLFLYIPSILYAMGLSLTTSYLVFLFVVNVSTCLISYYCIEGCINDSKLALIGSAIYTLCSYRLTDVYIRAALGEYVAMCFLPLVVYGFYKVYTAPKGQKFCLSDYLPIIIGLSGIAQSHILSLEMIAIFIGIFCIVMLKKTLEWERFWCLAKAAILTLLGNLFILVPFLSGMSMDIKVNGTHNYIEGAGTYLMQIFGIFYPGYQYSGVSGGAKNEMPLSIGFSLTLGLVLFLIVYLWRKEFKKDNRYQLASGTFLLSLLAIFFASTLFPWDSLDMISFRLFDILTKIQFPWRYLSLASVFAVFSTIASLSIIKEKSVKGYYCVSVAIIAILILNTGIFMMDQIDTSGETKAVSNSYEYNMSVGNGEYLIAGTDTSLLSYQNLIYDDSKLKVTDYGRNNGITTVAVQNTGTDDVILELPLQNYDNYHAYDLDTKDEYEIVTGSNNRLSIDVPGGYSGSIIVEYRDPIYWKISYWISAISIVCMILLSFAERRKQLSSNN